MTYLIFWGEQKPKIQNGERMQLNKEMQRRICDLVGVLQGMHDSFTQLGREFVLNCSTSNLSPRVLRGMSSMSSQVITRGNKPKMFKVLKHRTGTDNHKGITTAASTFLALLGNAFEEGGAQILLQSVDHSPALQRLTERLHAFNCAVNTIPPS